MSDISTRKFRSLMSRFVTGVTVIAVSHETAPAGFVAMTASAVTAVSLDPLLLLCCIRNESSLLPILRECGEFSVNVLSSGQDAVSQYYGGKPDKGAPGTWAFERGVPILHGANASFICEVSEWQRVGDHTVVYGAVGGMNSMEPPAPALVYAAGRYSNVELAL
ncbi:flavin reductase family protein [Variovorax sp. ZT5P49]|uniref:flavin reductase family protein n=1 Tax=Variovorax sp. ZT5P49 TaxID=3443733 RepID=UPI003F44A980